MERTEKDTGMFQSPAQDFQHLSKVASLGSDMKLEAKVSEHTKTILGFTTGNSEAEWFIQVSTTTSPESSSSSHLAIRVAS